MFNKLKFVLFSALALCLSALGVPAFAAGTGPDLSPLTSSIDFSTVVTAIMAVAAAIIVVHIAWKGAKMVLAAVKGA